MNNNEAINTLKNMSKYHFRDHWTHSTSAKDKKAIAYSVQCVELLPELLEALEDAVIKLEADWYLGDNKKELIQKAKEIVE